MKTTVKTIFAAHHCEVKQLESQRLRSGYNTSSDGEEIYFISNPATGLWRAK